MFDNICFHIDTFLFSLKYKLGLVHLEPYDEAKPMPKILHYCWFGPNPYPPIIEKCLASHAKCKGYQVKKWDESNFPFDLYPFAKEAYKEKKWAFVADVARLHAVYTEGGIHVDTDVEIIKSFDDLLNYGAFGCIEDGRSISLGTFGGKKHNPWLGLILQFYKGLSWHKRYGVIASPRIYTMLMRKLFGVRIKGQPLVLPYDAHIMEEETLLPLRKEDGSFCITDKTYVIHYGTGLWSEDSYKEQGIG